MVALERRTSTFRATVQYTIGAIPISDLRLAAFMRLAGAAKLNIGFSVAVAPRWPFETLRVHLFRSPAQFERNSVLPKMLNMLNMLSMLSVLSVLHQPRSSRDFENSQVR